MVKNIWDLLGNEEVNEELEKPNLKDIIVEMYVSWYSMVISRILSNDFFLKTGLYM